MREALFGSKWWKVDFHTHTPASDDYGKGVSEDEKITPEDWCLNFMRAGIDCVAITDHNSGEWIDKIKETISNLKNSDNKCYRDLFVIPGVEITVDLGVHVLILFNEKYTSSDIIAFLGAIKYRGTHGETESCAEESIIEILKEVRKREGIIIPAHVDESKGIFRELSGVSLNGFLDSELIFAMEVKNNDFIKPEIYRSKKINWSEVSGSDSHHSKGRSGQNYPGSHFTWLKMDEPSFEGIKLALFDGKTSIKHQSTQNPNQHTDMLIEELVITEAKYIGRGVPYKKRFNPWLNTIVGGRGTGKSSSIEFLRIALDRKEEIPEKLASEYSKYHLSYKNREDEGLLTDNTKISIIYKKDMAKYKIEWDFNSEKSSIYALKENGEWEVAPGNVKQRFPVRIYSQKQIFEMANRPEALLKIIDDSEEVNYKEWEQKNVELMAKYLSIQAQRRVFLSKLQEKNSLLGEKDDVNKKLSIFGEGTHQKILSRYKDIKNQKKYLESFDNEIYKKFMEIKFLIEEVELCDFQVIPLKDEGIVEVKKYLKDILAIKNNLIEEINKLDKAKSEFIKNIEDIKIYEEIENVENDYLAKKEELSKLEITYDDYDLLLEKKDKIENSLQILTGIEQKYDELEKEAIKCLEEIDINRKDISTKRRGFLSKILSNNKYINIEIQEYKNINTMEANIRKLLNKAQGFDRDIGDPTKEEGIIFDILKNSETGVKNFKEKILKIFNKSGEINVIDSRFITHISALNPENIDRLMCWYPEDSIKLEYRFKEGVKYKPIDQGSPGQKTAALLSFILSYGREPLILDQPEDDLDNKLITELIVSQIKNIKKDRQIILVTHNANIVVNGDSENVMVMDIVNGKSEQIATGGLQKRDIREKICEIMEGGTEAFEQRYKRINIGNI